MRTGIFPGSFDPVTYGHLDIIKRVEHICDKLIVAVAKNSQKVGLFSVEERLELLNFCCRELCNFVEVVSFDGLLVDYCRANSVSFIIRGVRGFSDFEYENMNAAVNKKLAPEIETLYMIAGADTHLISSRVVREVASYHKSVSEFVPPFVAEKILQKFKV
jgi:pantetheine-phosphate adenylyltransferase